MVSPSAGEHVPSIRYSALSLNLHFSLLFLFSLRPKNAFVFFCVSCVSLWLRIFDAQAYAAGFQSTLTITRPRGFAAEDAFDLRFDIGQFDFAIDEALELVDHLPANNDQSRLRSGSGHAPSRCR